MKYTLSTVIAITALLLSACSTMQSSKKTSSRANASSEAWEPIFNGKNLDGWDLKIAGHALNDNYKNTFRVDSGMLRICYDQYTTFDDKYGHIYYKKPYSYYKIRFEYRFTGNQTKGGESWNVRNSGVMIHSQSAQSLTLGQTFPVSLEIQTLGGLGNGVRHTANLCTPGTQVYMGGKLNDQHCIDSGSKTYDGDQWVAVEAIVLGDSIIHHLINHEVVLTYEKPIIGGGFIGTSMTWEQAGISNGAEWDKKAGTPLKEGYIALQAESHPIDFRNVEVLNLKGCTDPKAVNYKSYYVKSDNSTCKYK